MNAFADIVRTLQPYAIGISFAAVYIAEHLIPQRRELIDHTHDGKNILVGLLNLAIAGVGGYFLQHWLTYTSSHHFGLLHLLPPIFWLKIASGFILIDILMYWWHRVNHEYRFLWQFHRFHHMDEKMNSTTAVRFHAAEIIFSYVLRFSLFPLLGIDIAAVFLHGIVLFPVILFHHSNVRISERWDKLLRFFFVTPHMHRIHHSRIRKETDSNYGSVFPYWDPLFGSYTHKPEKDIEFGV
ncbi:Fatty acid hydroxylase superfamily protein [Cnuella takakiae]|uniref:Fatty acid hydroxylase superfamily protein n=1 Tax=Cnuella takakiae TaxID=1302690 RepID=A0A1M4SJF1_9BACT|nr:sterol desaturase family protein [Cnuella takakiae]OLY94523.1 hypothetical protein BUE76_23605 [Cnuella takakiae]SHE32325.1 Fatty acid hydroxylase superfamily protein [Cnuella takakiae]